MGGEGCGVVELECGSSPPNPSFDHCTESTRERERMRYVGFQLSPLNTISPGYAYLYAHFRA